MKRQTFIITLILFLCISLSKINAQSIIFDPGHFEIVMENGLTREAAESTHQNYLSTINQRLSDINLDVSSVVLVQNMIYNSLANVDGTLKNGLAVRQIAAIIAEISSQCSQMAMLAKDDPALLLFAQDVAGQLKDRGLKLITEVSSFVLKEGDNVLMDYEKRDQLLRKIVLELQVMRALSYSMYKSMYWARERGIFKSADPFQQFINQDTRLADGLILQYNILKQ
jgi:hypothetical protein